MIPSHSNKPLDKETLDNRRAANDLLHEAATRGNDLAGMTVELMSLAHQHNSFLETMDDMRDEDEDDNFRPY